MKKVAIRVIEASQLQIGDTIMVNDNGLAVIADIESRVPIMGSVSQITYTIRDNKDMPRLVCINVTDGFRFQQYIEEQEQGGSMSNNEALKDKYARRLIDWRNDCVVCSLRSIIDDLIKEVQQEPPTPNEEIEVKVGNKIEPQVSGGIMEIPDGWFVANVNLDADPPHIEITDTKDGTYDNSRKILVPKALAYYLSRHWCGSQIMHDTIESNYRRRIANSLTQLLGITGCKIS